MQTSAPTTYVTLTVNGRDVISLESPELCEAAAKICPDRAAGIELELTSAVCLLARTPRAVTAQI